MLYRLLLPLVIVVGCCTFNKNLFVTSFVVWPGAAAAAAASSSSSCLFSGVGIAKDYTWREEAFEIEVTVKVPPETKAKDISFKAKQNSIELKLSGDEEKVLLDPERSLRGKVVVDGTFWVISDNEDDNDNDDDDSATTRQVTVTIEKQTRRAKDDFDVVDYDWNGVYREEEEGEVSFRKYDGPEELDVREYAASLGVDIDNINMSMVDKTMFSSGLNNANVTQRTVDSLAESGLVQEVTQQGDGSEWITDKDGEKVPFNTMGKGVSPDELRQSSSTIPFLDTDSPWHRTPNEEEEDSNRKQQREKLEEKKKKLKIQREQDAMDPIATLTVARLREILRSRGMKVSGNKKELQDRLRAEVNSMMVGEQQQEEEGVIDTSATTTEE